MFPFHLRPEYYIRKDTLFVFTGETKSQKMARMDHRERSQIERSHGREERLNNSNNPKIGKYPTNVKQFQFITN